MKSKVFDYLVIFFITTFFCLFILWKCNVYPFTNNALNIIDYDGGYIPTYYKLWDILHGESSILFDWNLGAGLNCFGSMIMNGFLSPTSLIIGLFNRNFIPYAVEIVLYIKILCIAIICFYSLKKIFPDITRFNRIIFTMLYTFSGWTLLMMSNILYLDSVALFPLFVYGFLELLKKGKIKLFIICLTLVLLFSFYIAYMYLFFIIIFGTLYLLFFDVKDKKQKAIKILLCTLVSLGLSLPIVLPALSQTLGSFRMSTNTSDASIFDSTEFLNKSIYIFTIGLPFVLMFKQLFVKKDKKFNTFMVLVMFLLLIGVIIEPINALWHTGSHSGFPFRYSFIPIFMSCLFGNYFLTNNFKESKKINVINCIITGIIIVWFIIYSFYINDFIGKYNFASFVPNFKVYIFLAFLFIFLILIYIMALKNKYTSYILLLVVFIQTFTFNYYYIKSSTDSTSLSSQNILDNFNLINDGYNYIDLTSSSNTNFPYILKVPSIQNRLHFVKKEEIDMIKYFGYNGYDTVINSSGSNIFFNLLLQNKYIITNTNLDEKLYELIDSKGDIKYYKSIYNTNYIIPYNGKVINELEDNPFINANNIYKTLFDSKSDFFKKEKVIKNNNTYSFTIEENKHYYLVSKKLNINDDFKIHFEPNNLNYLANVFSKNYYQLQLETWAEETKNASLNIDNINDLEIYSFDYETLDSLCSKLYTKTSVMINKNVKTYNYYANKNTNILIPLNYDDGVKIYVNGKEQSYIKNLINFISIDVKKGDNVIKIEYIPKYIKEGLIISIISLILLIISVFLNKKYRILNNKVLCWILFSICLILVILFFIKVYILSLF